MTEGMWLVIFHVGDHTKLDPSGNIRFMCSRGTDGQDAGVKFFDTMEEARIAAREYQLRHQEFVRCYVTRRDCLM